MLSKRSMNWIASPVFFWLFILGVHICSPIAFAWGQERASHSPQHGSTRPIAGVHRTKPARPRAVLALDGGEKSGWILQNDGFDEDNTDAGGNSVPDFYPDWLAGDRINPNDDVLIKATLQLHGVGRARWKLLFPAQIKVWLVVQGKPKQVLSGVASTEVALPRTIPLLIEGIQDGATGFKLVAVVSWPTSKSSISDAVPLTVRTSNGLGSGSGGFASDPTPTPNPWSNWPDCASSTWAQSESQSLKREPRRIPPPRGNGLPVVTVTFPTVGAVLRELPALTGTAKSGNKNSFLKRIEFSLSYSDPLSKKSGFWDGSKWIAKLSQEPRLVAEYENGKWRRAAGLPKGRNLSSGTYSMEVRAYDNFDQWNYTYSWFVIDRNPEVTITTPASNAKVATYDSIRGTVTSPTGKRITEVRVRLSRDADGETGRQQFWNGTTWVLEPTAPLSATLNASTREASQNWQLQTVLRPDVDLKEGLYRVVAAASDEDGNRSYTENRFVVWRRPRVTITSPTGKASKATVRLIEGTVQLVPGGTPAPHVQVQLWREAPQPKYWNGTAWITPPAGSTSVPPDALLPAVYELPTTPDFPGKWKVEAMPTDADLPEGRYWFVAQALDGATVVAQDLGGFQIFRGPHISFDWPLDGAIIAQLGTVHGTAQPGVSGAPIASVEMSLTRAKPAGGYETWNGRVWEPVPARFAPLKATWTPPATVGASASGTWKRDFGWPPAEDLAGKSYFLTAGVRDMDGRVANVTVSFRAKQK